MDTHIVNTEEENISEAGAHAAHNSKRSKSKRTSIESLPDDVMFDILIRVPAQDIYHAARLVCHKWFQTTRNHDFVRAQHQQSTIGLLITQHNNGSQSNKQLFFATQQKGHRIMEKCNYKFTGNILSSCSGLILECYYKKPKLEFLITNPATNQHLNLPSFVPDTVFYNFAIACRVASKEYKVVRSFYNLVFEEVECAILTVGVDEDWKRRVDIQHLSPAAMKLLRQRPSTTQGFVHWARFGGSPFHDYVLTLNVETEIITQFPAVPPPSLLCGGETKLLLYRYLPMGSCLSLLIARAKNKFPIWDQVWVMKPETGEWTRMMSIDSESQKRAFEGVSAPLNCMFRPVAWLKFREVLVLQRTVASDLGLV